jgi:VWFA-related protein
LSANRRVLSSFLGAALVAASSGLAAQQTPRFAGQTDAILLDVLVSRGGAAVEGLTAADFTVKDSGVAQTVQLLQAGSLPISLLLAFDTSTSVRGTPLEHLKEAAKAAVASLRPTDEAALLTFSHSLILRIGWTSSKETLTKAIDGLAGQGFTALNDAAFAAMAMTAKPGTRRLVLFFTDGDDTSSWAPASGVVQAARRSDAIIYNVTLDAPGNSGAAIAKLLEGPRKSGDLTRADTAQWMNAEPNLYRGALLPLLSMETGGESFRTTDTAKLTAAFSDIVSRFSRRYVLAFTPTGVPPTGWHPIEIEVKGGADVNARTGYLK